MRILPLALMLASTLAPAARPKPPRVRPMSPSRRRCSPSTASRPTRAAPGRARRSRACCSTRRMVQGIFDDLNPETRDQWAYPDTASGTPSATRASSSPPCRSGASTACSAFTINLQGGSPQGYSQGPALAQLGLHRRRHAAARLPGPARADPRQGRRAGHGRHPRHLLLRPGRAAEGRGGRRCAASTTPSTGSSTRATATC